MKNDLYIVRKWYEQTWMVSTDNWHKKMYNNERSIDTMILVKFTCSSSSSSQAMCRARYASNDTDNYLPVEMLVSLQLQIIVVIDWEIPSFALYTE